MSPPNVRRRPRVVLACLLVLVALATAAGVGYALGHRGGEDLSRARAHAARLGAREGAARGRRVGYAQGFARAKDAAYSMARRRAYAATYHRPRPVAPTPAPTTAVRACPPGQYTTSSGSCAPDPRGYGTPPANSPEGKAMVNATPGCSEYPPPPDYSGPVQCAGP